MTISDFQTTLRDALLETFKDIRGKGPDGTVRPISGFTQGLPVIDTDEEEDSRFPYFIVRLSSGSDSELAEVRGSVKTLILLGCYDDAKDNQGHKTILNMIQRFRERFEKNPLAGSYRMRPKIDWALQDEDTYPYYFGGIEVEWDILQLRKEDQFS